MAVSLHALLPSVTFCKNCVADFIRLGLPQSATPTRFPARTFTNLVKSSRIPVNAP